VIALGMPAVNGWAEFDGCADRILKRVADEFRSQVADLTAHHRDLWEPTERPLREHEWQEHGNRFDWEGRTITDEIKSEFKSQTPATGETASGPPMSADYVERARRWAAFVNPILAQKGWAQTEWATEAGVTRTPYGIT
jgi:hypothetical protein